MLGIRYGVRWKGALAFGKSFVNDRNYLVFLNVHCECRATNQILPEVLNLWGEKAQITRKKNYLDSAR